MPAPVVYVVVGVVATVAAGVAFKQFVYDPHIHPKLQQWREELKALHRARRARSKGPMPPHLSFTEDRDMQESIDGASLVELESLGPISKSSSVQSSGGSPDLRLRRTRQAPESQPRVLDESIAEIPYPPLAPTSLSSSNRSATMSPPVVSILPDASFVLGSEPATIASQHSSPGQLHMSSINASPIPSPTVLSPRVQLPTPPSERSEYSSPVRSPPQVLSPRSASPTYATNNTHLALSMSMSHSMSSSLSFNTPLTDFRSLSPSVAHSPPTDFRSLSPGPSQPTSPFTDAMTFYSGDSDRDDMYSFHSHSSESLLHAGGRIGQSQPERGHETITGSTFSEFTDDDSFSERGSDASWEELSATRSPGTMSPRH